MDMGSTSISPTRRGNWWAAFENPGVAPGGRLGNSQNLTCNFLGKKIIVIHATGQTALELLVKRLIIDYIISGRCVASGGRNFLGSS